MGHFISAAVFDYIPSIYAAMTWLMIVILVPLACFRWTRPAAAVGFTIFLPAFVFMTWVESGAVIYLYRGLASGISWGIFGAGVGTVLIALWLTVVHGTWGDAFGFAVMIFALLGATLGFALTMRWHTPAAKRS